MNSVPIEGIVINLLIPGLGYILIAGIAYMIFYKFFISKWHKRKIQGNYPSNSTIRMEILYSIRSFLIWMGLGFIIVWAVIQGNTKIYLDLQMYSYTYYMLSLLLIIMLHDGYFYWTHRLMHHPKLFKVMHRTHHQFHNPTPWSAFAFSPLEALVQAAYFPILVWIIPFHWTILAGFLIYMICMNVIGHLGFEIFGPNIRNHTIGSWSNSSTDHNLHHQKGQGNYGLYFKLWDRLMNTTSTQKSRF